MKKLRFGWLAALMLLFILLLLKQLFLSSSGVWTIHSLNNQIASETAENNHIQARNQIILSKVVNLRTGDKTIESRAREELGLVKQDEVFYQIVNS